MLAAGLPMYAFPELTTATADWWAGLRRHFQRVGLPELSSTVGEPEDLYAHWLQPDLLFTQTCGYPLTHDLAGRVQLVATPCYSAPGCEGATYHSVVVVRETDNVATMADLRGQRVAFNSRDSQSGYNALRSLVAPLARNGRFFGGHLETGGHRRSLAAVREGRADVAALDCVSYALIAAVAPVEIQGIRVITMTEPAPNLPFISAQSTSPDLIARLRDGLRAAMVDPDLQTAREALLIAGVEILPLSAYDRILMMEQVAVSAGYPDLD